MSMESNQTNTKSLMPRQRPEQIPSIHPLPEYLATGQIAEWYEETKETLQVPWMGVVTMAFAHYPTFFGELWRGIKPLCQSEVFVEASRDLRGYVEQRTRELQPRSLVPQLTEIGYAPREIEAIRQMNDVFSHGNQPYAIIATIARYLLEIGDIGQETETSRFQGRHAPEVNVPFILIEAHHADSPTQAVYDDIKRVLTLPFVNTDYRAFARWPSYFALAWGELREIAATPPHENICLDCHNRIVKMVTEDFPNPGGLDAAALRQAADEDAGVEEVLEVCRLFQWLLPGLITNVAFFSHQLTEG